MKLNEKKASVYIRAFEFTLILLQMRFELNAYKNKNSVEKNEETLLSLNQIEVFRKSLQFAALLCIQPYLDEGESSPI